MKIRERTEAAERGGEGDNRGDSRKSPVGLQAHPLETLKSMIYTSKPVSFENRG